nr:MAG: putative maturation protein [Leviviridae sp.]
MRALERNCLQSCSQRWYLPVARTIRTRTSSVTPPVGSYHQYFFGSTVDKDNSGTIGYKRGICSDSHGRPTDDCNLLIEKLDKTGITPVTGAYSYGADFNMSAVGFIPSGIQLSSPGHLVTGVPSASSSMTDLIARTNPSRPGVTPLTLAQDLVDLPRMLKDIPRLIRTPRSKLGHKDAANQYLGFQFGWLPLIQDAKELINLAEHVQKRKRELDRLYSGSGLRRRIRLGKWDAESASTGQIMSEIGCSITSRASLSTHVDRWGVVRWLPDNSPGHNPTDDQQLQKARQIVSGISSEATILGAWDLIPWLWLVGWFTNARSYLLQYSNTVPASHQRASIMTHSVTKIDYQTITISNGFSGGHGRVTYETKERYVGPGTISAHLPFISGKRLAILGALFSQRFKR